MKKIESRQHLFHDVIDQSRVIPQHLRIYRKKIFQSHRHILHYYSYLYQLALFHCFTRLLLMQTQKFKTLDDIRMPLPFIELSNYTYLSSTCLCYLERLMYVLEDLNCNISPCCGIHCVPYLTVATLTNQSLHLIVCLVAQNFWDH